jgi:hypothetical protein
LLREAGWLVHDITDHFVNDAQDVSDPDWMKFGLERGWSLLTQDKRIRNQVEALQLLNHYRGQIFCLSSGGLLVRARAARFEAHRAAINHHTGQDGAGFFVVYDHGVTKRWP